MAGGERRGSSEQDGRGGPAGPAPRVPRRHIHDDPPVLPDEVEPAAMGALLVLGALSELHVALAATDGDATQRLAHCLWRALS